jgi:predicted PurR-regulated permease PerM
MLVGISLLVTTLYGVAAALSGFIVLLVVAVVIGILASPLVDVLHRYHVPRQLGAIIVILALLGIIVGSVAVSVRGIIDQADEIHEQLTAGVEAAEALLADIDIDLGLGVAGDRVDEAGDFGVDWIGGLASYASTIFSGVLAFVVGSFLALFFLYYVLADWHRLRAWVGRNLAVPDDLGAGIVDDVTSLVRRGFYALSASSLVTAVLIGAAMLILDLPLAFTVALVTFVTSYIPYLGAIFSGTFGFLVALGAGGTTDAIILLVVILVVQNVVQTVVGNRLASTSLSLHPIAALISTIVGAAIAGLLGAMLSAPVLAAIIAIRKRVTEYEPPAAAAAVDSLATASGPGVDDAR